MNEKKWFFSLFSGDIYEVDVTETKFLDAFQIPLLAKPDCKNCKKCYGRLHTGFDVKERAFVLCKKCGRKYVDLQFMLENKKS